MLTHIEEIAKQVESEWRNWLAVPDHLPTPELLDTLTNLLETILGRKLDLEKTCQAK